MPCSLRFGVVARDLGRPHMRTGEKFTFEEICLVRIVPLMIRHAVLQQPLESSIYIEPR